MEASKLQEFLTIFAGAYKTHSWPSNNRLSYCTANRQFNSDSAKAQEILFCPVDETVIQGVRKITQKASSVLEIV